MTAFVDDPDFTLHVGDALDVLASLPDESVHCVVTSPPYWGLRDYGTGSWDGGNEHCDHKAPPTGGPNPVRYTTGGGEMFRAANDKLERHVCGKCGARRTDHQLGLEPTPDQYVTNMVNVFREVRRVLRRDGTCWLNIGDSYGSGTMGRNDAESLGEYDRRVGHAVGAVDERVARRAQNRGQSTSRSGLKPKDLVGIPWRLAFALQADGWYLRSDIIWSKPNPMPESVTDRPTKAHEYVFLLSRSPRYYFDQDAIREPAEWARWGDQTNDKYEGTRSGAGWIKARSREDLLTRGPGGNLKDAPKDGFINGGGWAAGPVPADRQRNKRSVWEIATQPYPDAHFATFPQALVEPCVLAGTSERGCCPECGAPWEREVTVPQNGKPDPNAAKAHGGIGNNLGGGRHQAWRNENPPRTTGWRPTCEHGHAPIPATVCDPFMGSGTTALVARRLGRRTIGIELSAEYATLAAERLQQLSLFADEPREERPPPPRARGLTGGAYSPPGQTPHSNARRPTDA